MPRALWSLMTLGENHVARQKCRALEGFDTAPPGRRREAILVMPLIQTPQSLPTGVLRSWCRLRVGRMGFFSIIPCRRRENASTNFDAAGALYSQLGFSADERGQAAAFSAEECRLQGLTYAASRPLAAGEIGFTRQAGGAASLLVAPRVPASRLLTSASEADRPAYVFGGCREASRARRAPVISRPAPPKRLVSVEPGAEEHRGGLPRHLGGRGSSIIGGSPRPRRRPLS